MGQIRAAGRGCRSSSAPISGFAREELLAGCEANGVDYVFGLARNQRLVGAIAPELAAAAAESLAQNGPVRHFADVAWRTLDSWGRTRRVVAKAEHVVEEFQGQSAPELPGQLNLDRFSIDEPILDALIERWRQRYLTRTPHTDDRKLFRSFNMTNQTSEPPPGAIRLSTMSAGLSRSGSAPSSFWPTPARVERSGASSGCEIDWKQILGSAHDFSVVRSRSMQKDRRVDLRHGCTDWSTKPATTSAWQSRDRAEPQGQEIGSDLLSTRHLSTGWRWRPSWTYRGAKSPPLQRTAGPGSANGSLNATSSTPISRSLKMSSDRARQAEQGSLIWGSRDSRRHLLRLTKL